MSSPAAILREEHVAIREFLDVVGGMADALRRGEKVPREDLDAVVEFMETFTDKNHRAKEEELFTVMSRESTVSDRSYVHRLEVEHAACRKIVSALRTLEPSVEAGDALARRDFGMYLRSYRMRTRDHLRDEARTLMPWIENRSGLARYKAVVETLDRLDESAAGARLREKYRGVVERLADRYTRPALAFA